VVESVKRLLIGLKKTAQQGKPIGQIIKILVPVYCQVPSAEMPIQRLATCYECAAAAAGAAAGRKQEGRSVQSSMGVHCIPSLPSTTACQIT